MEVEVETEAVGVGDGVITAPKSVYRGGGGPWSLTVSNLYCASFKD